MKPCRPHVARLLALLLSSSTAAPLFAATTAARSPVVTIAPRDASSLPSFASAPSRIASHAGVPDTTLVLAHSFTTLAGDCDPRGWVGEDRTDDVFMQVGTLVTNRPFYAGVFTPSFPAAVSPISTTPLGVPHGIAVLDSGQVFLHDVSGAFGPSTRCLYPSQDLMRSFGTPPPGTKPVDAYDPVTRGVISTASSVSWILTPDGARAILFGGGASPLDTTATAAQLPVLAQIAVDGTGNVFFAEFVSGRVRYLRRNDMRVVTVPGISFPGGNGIAVTADGSTLYLTNRARVIQIADPMGASPIETEVAVNPATPSVNPRLLELSGSTLYLAADRIVYRVEGGTIVPVLGSSNLYEPLADARLGTNHILRDIGDLAGDGAGGVYVTDPTSSLVLRLLANGQVENTAGVLIPISMGNRALVVGADMTTHPGEVANWTRDRGYGNDWSQRLVSAPIDFDAHSVVTVEFDATMEIENAGELDEFSFGNNNEFVAVQIEDGSGNWFDVGTLTVYSALQHGQYGNDSPISALGSFHCTADVSSSGSRRIRLVVQTNITGSDEDGLSPVPATAAAVLDNIAVRDGSTDILAFTDFEDGTLNGWTISAYNATHTGPGAVQWYSRDGALPNSVVDLQDNFDFADPTCAFKFTSASGHVENQVLARLTSPWVPNLPVLGPDPTVHLVFDGKFPNRSMAKTVTVWMRGKNAGDSRPSFASPAFFTLFNNGLTGGDLIAPFIKDRVIRYPVDFQFPAPCDSIQFFFLVEDRWEDFISQSFTVNREVSKLPYLDNIRIFEIGIDDDHDGVPNANDDCPALGSAGEDADGDGCPDANATLHHVESWTDGHRPIRYTYSNQNVSQYAGQAGIVLDAAFATWAGVAGADVPLIKELATSQALASAMDGVNMITFADNTYPFSPEVLAVTPTLSLAKRGPYDDQLRLPAEILDADILFNPGASFATPGHTGAWDLQSVATHEIGHLLGLSHSGVSDATMYFVQLPGQLAASLSPDDESAVSAAYPDDAALANFGAIRGRITRDTVETGDPSVPGALVTAVRLDNAGAVLDTVASDYSREDGSYALLRLPPGDYGVHIQALDGSVLNGLMPNFISQRLFDISTRRTFEPEWANDDDHARDDPSNRDAYAVVAGNTLAGVDVVTNLDSTSTSVTTVSPPDGATNVQISSSVQLNFTEAVAAPTLSQAFRLVPTGGGPSLAGGGLLSNFGRTFIFSPRQPLQFATTYTIELGTALTDLNGVPLAAPFSASFTTIDEPALSLANVDPSQAPIGAVITLTGGGYQPTNAIVANQVMFRQGATIDSVPAGFTTHNSMLATVPQGFPAGATDVFVRQISTTAPNAIKVGSRMNVGEFIDSNPVTITVLPPAEAPSPSSSGTPIALGWAPQDVASSPTGDMVYAVGDGGFATINLSSPSGGPLRTAVQRFTSGAKSIGITPNGRRGVISQPADSQIVIVDTDPASGGLGSVLATIPTPGSPDQVAIAPNGLHAYVTAAAETAFYEVDLNEAGSTPFQLLNVRGFESGQGPFRSIAVHPGGDIIYLGTAIGRFSYFLSTGNSDQTGSFNVTGGIATSLDGTHRLSCLGAGGVQYQGFGAGPIVTGGIASDVAFTPQGQAAYIVNESLNQLQIVGLDSSIPALFLTVLSNAPTGATPVAVSTSGDGGLIAVANRGGHSISLYQVLGGLPALSRVASDVAFPDQVIGAQGDATSNFFGGTQADFGSGLEPATAEASVGAGFRVPSLPPRNTQLVLQRADGLRSFALPFEILDPIGALDPHTAFTFPVADTSDGAISSLVGFLSQLRVSPDGRMLGVIRQSGLTGIFLDLYSLARDGSSQYGGLIGTCLADDSHTLDIVPDFEFTPDGKRAFVATRNLGARIIDTDPSSATFAQIVGFFGIAEYALIGDMAPDPLGRWVAVGSSIGSLARVGLHDNTGALGALAVTGLARSVCWTGDGRYLVEAMDSLKVVDLFTDSQVAGNVDHHAFIGSGEDFDALVTTLDGRRAAGLYGGNLVVWNLDATAGPIGQVLFAGFPPNAPAGQQTGSFRHLLAGPDTKSIILGAPNDTLFRLDLSVVPPVSTPIPLGVEAFASALSPDGRTLFITTRETGGGFGNSARVVAIGLSESQALAVESGPGQAANPGTELPLPVQVKVTGPLGRAEPGALVQFSLASGQGSIVGALDPSIIRVTDANGEASVRWTMPGTGPTAQMLIQALGVPGASAVVSADVTIDNALIEPVIVSLSPFNGSTGLNATTPVAARFNQAMHPSTGALLHLTANGADVPGSTSFTDGGRFLIFQPNEPLPYSAHCVFTVDAGAVDTDGQLLANGGSTAFDVQAPPATTILSLSPPAGPPGAAVGISGTGFNALLGQNVTLFNGTLAGLTQGDASSLTAVVPLGATSGPVTVQNGASLSPGFNFIVLPPDPTLGGTVGDLDASQGIRDMAITPDGTRAYVTNPSLNTVTALDLIGATTITSITVGLKPQAVAILASPQRAYVANTLSGSLSVIDIDPNSANYHQVIDNIPVGVEPVDVAISAAGPKVYVLNAGSSSLSVIDAQQGNATFHQVVTTVNTGASGGQGVAVSADGSLALIVGEGGLTILDLKSGQVVTTVNTGASGGQGVAVSADGTLAFVVTSGGTLLVIQLAPGNSQYQVVTTVNTGASGGQGVAVSADGTRAFVTDAEGNQVFVYAIGSGASGGTSTVLPGPPVRMSLEATLPTGAGPSAVAVNPLGLVRTYIVNSGAGTVQVIGTPDALPLVSVDFEFSPGTLNVKSMGRWVQGVIVVPEGYDAHDIDLSSVRLEGTIPVDLSGPVSYCGGDPPGECRTLEVKFDRAAIQIALPAGDEVEVCVTGEIGTRNFAGCDTIRVKHGKVTHPAANSAVQPLVPTIVTWETPNNVHVEWVAILHLLPGQTSWRLDADHVPNTGSFEWTPPIAATDSARLAVVWVENEISTPEAASQVDPPINVEGVLAVSDLFTIFGVTAVEPAPVVLTFSPVVPNPAFRAATMRFGLPSRSNVSLDLYDLQGRRVHTLAKGVREAGWHTLAWRGETEGRGRARPGMYFARLKVNGQELRHTFVWLE